MQPSRGVKCLSHNRPSSFEGIINGLDLEINARTLSSNDYSVAREQHSMPSFLRLLAPPPTFTPNPSPYLDPNGKKYSFNSLSYSSRMKTMLNARMCISTIPANNCSARYAVLGAGFAGLSVAWHLLQVYSFLFSYHFCF